MTTWRVRCRLRGSGTSASTVRSLTVGLKVMRSYKSHSQSFLPSLQLVLEWLPPRGAGALVSLDHVPCPQRIEDVRVDAHVALRRDHLVECLDRQLRQGMLPFLLAPRHQRADDVMRSAERDALRDE